MRANSCTASEQDSRRGQKRALVRNRMCSCTRATCHHQFSCALPTSDQRMTKRGSTVRSRISFYSIELMECGPAGAEDHGWPTHSSEHPLPPSESGCKLRLGRGWPRRAERDTNPYTQAYRPTEARLPPFGGSVFSSRSSKPWLADSLKKAPKQKVQGSRPQRS